MLTCRGTEEVLQSKIAYCPIKLLSCPPSQVVVSSCEGVQLVSFSLGENKAPWKTPLGMG